MKEGQLPNGDPYVTYKPIDVYWQKILSVPDRTGAAKYSSLGRLVRLLSLSHGQADVERGFSINKATLGTERNSVNQDTLIALRIVKDELQQHENLESVPITKGLISSYRGAHRKYQEGLKAKRDEEMKTAQKRKLDSELEVLEKRKNLCVTEQKQAENMVSEANDHIAAAVKSGKFDDIRAAQALLEGGNKLLAECRQKYQEITDKIKSGQHQVKKQK